MNPLRYLIPTLAVAALSIIACTTSRAVTDASSSPAPISGMSLTQVPGHDSLTEDNSPKQGPRLMPVETYMRSYLTIFGGLSPLQAQTALAPDGLFDTWTAYLSVLGLPDYTIDIPRNTQTNALMLGAFERIGIALCDRAVEHDLMGMALSGVSSTPLVFTFTLPETETADAEHTAFTARFDSLHRRFLGYPQSLAPGRADTFWTLYSTSKSNQSAASVDAGYHFTPVQAGWAAVCYGLVRHPEFHLY
jgi:hypothetical protein